MRLIVAILIFMLAPVRAATAQDAARGGYLLKPEAVFDGVTAEAHRGGRQHGLGAGRRDNRRSAGHDIDAGDDRGPFAPVPPSL